MSASYLDTYSTCDNGDCRQRLFGGVGYRVTRQEANTAGINVKGSLISKEVELCDSCYEKVRQVHQQTYKSRWL